jgi:hypothetical protein
MSRQDVALGGFEHCFRPLSRWRRDGGFALVVVKSMNHFRAGFEPIAKAILYVAAPGAIDFDYRRIPYRNLRRPIYPLDDWGPPGSDPAPAD